MGFNRSSSTVVAHRAIARPEAVPDMVAGRRRDGLGPGEATAMKLDVEVVSVPSVGSSDGCA